MTVDEAIKYVGEMVEIGETYELDKVVEENRQLVEWLKDYKRLLEQQPILDNIRAEIKEWYWQADKQALAKDPCVVDAMIDLFIRTIDKYKAESEDKE